MWGGDYHPQLGEETKAQRSEWTCSHRKTKKGNKSGLFWGKNTRHLLLSAASCWCEEERARLSGFAKEASPAFLQQTTGTKQPGKTPQPASGTFHLPTLPPSQILGMPNCSGLQTNNQNPRIGLMAFRVSSGSRLAGQPAWSLHLNRCLSICPLSFRCSPGRWPEPGELWHIPAVCLHSSSLTFLLLNKIRMHVALLGRCEIETRFAVRHSENVHFPRFPLRFCWRFRRWLKYRSLSYPVLWLGPWGRFPGSEVTACWARRMSNCLSLQLNLVSYRCPRRGSPGSSAGPRIRPSPPADAMR